MGKQRKKIRKNELDNLDISKFIPKERSKSKRSLPGNTKGEREKAVVYLIENLPKGTLNKVRELIKKEGPGWSFRRHHGFGTGVRNTLRQGGFFWGDINLDNVWASLVEEAVKRTTKSELSSND